jgi:DNA-directed RNA polymerase specialized sigma24 family protein
MQVRRVRGMSDDERVPAVVPRAVREIGTDEYEAAFTRFVRDHGPRLKQSLVASLGEDTGRDAAAEALGWAWEHWPRLQTMDNPVGYLYRLGRNRGVSMLRRRPVFSPPHPGPPADGPWVEPGLPAAVARLSEKQRVAVLLVHGFGWTFREVADHLGVGPSTVQVHVERGMAKLRHDLKVEKP